MGLKDIGFEYYYIFAKIFKRMAKRKKNTEYEEEFEEVIAESNEGGLQSMLSKNQMILLGIVAAVVVLAGVYLAYKLLYMAPKEKTAMEQMFKAEFQFQQDSFALALEAPGGGYDGFLDVIDNYKGTKAANLSKYYAGICYLNLGRYEDAIIFLESHHAKGNITSVTKFGALGDAYSEVGDLNKALSAYEKASKGDMDVLTPYYLYKLGLLAFKEKDNAQALKAFQRIAKDFPNSIEASEATKYISLLN